MFLKPRKSDNDRNKEVENKAFTGSTLIQELSGSLGDLGVLLPFSVAFVSLAGFDPTGIFMGFGLAYLAAAAYFRAPVPVQPMKVIGAAVLVGQLNSGQVMASGIIMGAFLLLLAISGMVKKISGLIPDSVTMGIAAALGISLAMMGLEYVMTDTGLGLACLIIGFVLLYRTRLPVALLILLLGTSASLWLHPETIPNLPQLGFHLPGATIPQIEFFGDGFWRAFLPQLPLTLTNSVIVTAVLASRLYPDKAERITEQRLLISLGVANSILPLIGAFPLCHGSGGLAAHYRFGSRTALTPVLIGSLLITAAVLLGPEAIKLIKAIPVSVLGCLLFYSGLELMQTANKTYSRKEYLCLALVVVLSLTYNAGLGFIAGIAVFYVLPGSRVNSRLPSE